MTLISGQIALFIVGMIYLFASVDADCTLRDSRHPLTTYVARRIRAHKWLSGLVGVVLISIGLLSTALS